MFGNYKKGRESFDKMSIFIFAYDCQINYNSSYNKFKYLLLTCMCQVRFLYVSNPKLLCV